MSDSVHFDPRLPDATLDASSLPMSMSEFDSSVKKKKRKRMKKGTPVQQKKANSSFLSKSITVHTLKTNNRDLAGQLQKKKQEIQFLLQELQAAKNYILMQKAEIQNLEAEREEMITMKDEATSTMEYVLDIMKAPLPSKQVNQTIVEKPWFLTSPARTSPSLPEENADVLPDLPPPPPPLKEIHPCMSMITEQSQLIDAEVEPHDILASPLCKNKNLNEEDEICQEDINSTINIEILSEKTPDFLAPPTPTPKEIPEPTSTAATDDAAKPPEVCEKRRSKRLSSKIPVPDELIPQCESQNDPTQSELSTKRKMKRRSTFVVPVNNGMDRRRTKIVIAAKDETEFVAPPPPVSCSTPPPNEADKTNLNVVDMELTLVDEKKKVMKKMKKTAIPVPVSKSSDESSSDEAKKFTAFMPKPGKMVFSAGRVTVDQVFKKPKVRSKQKQTLPKGPKRSKQKAVQQANTDAKPKQRSVYDLSMEESMTEQQKKKVTEDATKEQKETFTERMQTVGKGRPGGLVESPHGIMLVLGTGKRTKPQSKDKNVRYTDNTEVHAIVDTASSDENTDSGRCTEAAGHTPIALRKRVGALEPTTSEAKKVKVVAPDDHQESPEQTPQKNATKSAQPDKPKQTSASKTPKPPKSDWANSSVFSPELSDGTPILTHSPKKVIDSDSDLDLEYLTKKVTKQARSGASKRSKQKKDATKKAEKRQPDTNKDTEELPQTNFDKNTQSEKLTTEDVENVPHADPLPSSKSQKSTKSEDECVEQQVHSEPPSTSMPEKPSAEDINKENLKASPKTSKRKTVSCAMSEIAAANVDNDSRRSRRGTSTVSYKEPSLNAKMRRARNIKL